MPMELSLGSRSFSYRYRVFPSLFLLLALAAIPRIARANNAAFDLSGPRIEIKVTRANKTLPVAEVPNLQVGDRLWLHPELPATQSVRYLLIASFLRGSTNPPPENWFTKIETWNKQVRQEGVVVTVPEGAQQALLFLAPETGGDFNTLRTAVRGRPGAFVRASQDLDQASLDHSRLEKYLGSVQQASDADPKLLHERSTLLARSLNIKLDQQCFDKPTEQQLPCLTQNSENLVLDDGHSQSMVAALTSGPSSDLIGQLSATSLAGGGFYSPYVGAIVDLARIMGSFHTAEYQYIPALALPKQDQLNLKLNNPPSFRKPMSVLVVGLPAVEAAQLPPLHAVDSNQVFCLQKSPLVLPVEGAPIVFSGELAHDFVLQIPARSGTGTDLPATADPSRGGFLVDTRALQTGGVDQQLVGTVNGSIRGFWGYQAFDGPKFHLVSAHPAKWIVPAGERNGLVVGREDTLHLQSDQAACVEQVTLRDPSGKEVKTNWKLSKIDELEVQVPLKDEAAGPIAILVRQAGPSEVLDDIPLHTYSEAGHLDHFIINAGDQQGVLKGTRLDEVASLEMGGLSFAPGALSRAEQKDELHLSSASGTAIGSARSNQDLVAQVTLKDGRVLNLQTTVEPARPKLTLLSKSIQPGATPSAVRLGNQDELPQDGRLSFFVKSEVPDAFPRSEKIEVATLDNAFDVLLSLSDGNLVLQDAQTVLATLDPLKSFGPSAFGSLHFRAVDANGSNGDWQALANLVRIPSLKEVRCPDSPDKQCTLSGTNLFLIESVASDSLFKHEVPVPLGFADQTVSVPRPNGTLLYLKLRDDPAAVNKAALPVLPE
jgi:hypothetical protein